MARNFDDMFNEALYGKRRRQDNTLIDNWIDECLFEDLEEEDINRSSVPTPRRWINRDREAGHDRLFQDYFADEPRVDAIGRRGLSPLQKCTAAIRMLAYGVAADVVDDYVCIGESTTIECLEKFVEGVILVFEDEYLREPNLNDVRRLLQMAEGRGFPGMLGSIGYMHWQWKTCPKAWKDRSPVFDDILNDRAPEVNYNGNNYTMGYYLADNIYSEWATFVKSISKPQGEKRKLFAQYQEGQRKDVE
ncbi:uncharacterized protein LOC107647262 [Arachis ipaensis]|uniref:uncharacterized protein LOC107647262 n=1 Tax=Arachis ipaensis TaxID=130454 RepID=UPI0007AF92E8|nr:uncharacterized protein LOC107647262 [Arachis ipaensis]